MLVTLLASCPSVVARGLEVLETGALNTTKLNSNPRHCRAMPSSSATGSPRLGARESVDEDLEGVVVVDAATARGGAGGVAAQSVAACHRVGMRASVPTTWAACPPTSTKPAMLRFEDGG